MRNAELRQALRLKVARRLAEADRRSIDLHEVAKALGVSERTLRNWRSFGLKAKKQGRPAHDGEISAVARIRIFELMKKHGAPGWRKIAAELNGETPVRLVQRYVAEYKAMLRKKAAPRSRTDVNGKNVMWSIDGAFMQRGKRNKHQVIKDRGTKKLIARRSYSSKSADVVGFLEDIRLKDGLPLVLSSDNGSAYKCKSLCSYLKRWQVVHLRSLPRTPQHNGAEERSIRELKEVAAIEKSGPETAVEIVNGRPRKYGLIWSSTEDIYENWNVQYNESDRAEFFNACTEKLNLLCSNNLTARQLRLNEREVILDELKVRGYINRWKLDEKCN